MIETLNLIPDLDQHGKFTGPSQEETKQMADDILSRGGPGVVEVIKLLQEVDDGTDYRPRYALHAIANHLLSPGREKARTLFNQTLENESKGDYPDSVKGYLVRQLQVSGTKQNVKGLAEFLSHDAIFEDAANALLAIGENAAEVFRKALPKAEGKRRLTVIQALGTLKDSASAGELRKAVSDPDETVRLSAAEALARIGDAQSVDALLKHADKATSTRFAATDACLLLAETLTAAGKSKEAAKVYQHLRDTRNDPSEMHIKELAETALGSIT